MTSHYLNHGWVTYREPWEERCTEDTQVVLKVGGQMAWDGHGQWVEPSSCCGAASFAGVHAVVGGSQW